MTPPPSAEHQRVLPGVRGPGAGDAESVLETSTPRPSTSAVDLPPRQSALSADSAASDITASSYDGLIIPKWHQQQNYPENITAAAEIVMSKK